MLKDLGRGPLVLLFYDGYEMQANDRPFGRALSAARSMLRAAYRRARNKQVNTGFYVAFEGLVNCLKAIGCDVRVNDFALARKYPDYPIGVAGYPGIVGKVAHLKNPMLYGPGDPGHPDQSRKVLETTNVRLMIQPSQWYVDFYAGECGDRVVRWPAGLDLKEIPDQSAHAKDIDVLIYDKIRWRRDQLVPVLTAPLEAHLAAKGLSYKVLRYGQHTKAVYFDALARSRACAFICEHETQGLACEEAMAMNVPVFAWDEGLLADVRQQKYAPPGLVVSSVPYFDDSCGATFKIDDMIESFDRFWSQRGTYAPRGYIQRELNLEKCGKDYLVLLEAADRYKSKA